MKLLSLLLAFFAVAQSKPTFTTPSRKAVLDLRGGASLGPLDSDMVAKCGDTALALYLGGSASKFVAGQSGGSAPDLTNILTNEFFSIIALTSAIANGAYFLGDTGFDSAQVNVILLGAAIAQKVSAAGGLDKIADVVSANRLLSAVFLMKLYITFV